MKNTIKHRFTLWGLSRILRFACLILSCCCSVAMANAHSPAIQQASVYHHVDDISAYWVSEKLDGVRARWTGKQLLSRNGYPFNPPLWFTAQLPNIALDGELWIARGQFERVSAKVRRHQSDDKSWRAVKFMLFDLPTRAELFTERIAMMHELVAKVNQPHVQVIAQYKVDSLQQLQAHLDRVVKAGGEGLMLHHGDAQYQTKRVAHLLKLKSYSDAEAVVLAHLPGKGKYKGMLGAIKVRDSFGVEFKIGTGFSDEQRRHPPPIGATITFKYFGKTVNQVPRFASFMRVRFVANSVYQ